MLLRQSVGKISQAESEFVAGFLHKSIFYYEEEVAVKMRKPLTSF